MKQPRKRTGSSVREPIQVYLTPDERSVLDRLAEELDISRAEVLRRGLVTYAVDQAKGRSPVLSLIKELRGEDWPSDAAERHDELLSQAYCDEVE